MKSNFEIEAFLFPIILLLEIVVGKTPDLYLKNSQGSMLKLPKM
jgi:hypothetical protein